MATAEDDAFFSLVNGLQAEPTPEADLPELATDRNMYAIDEIAGERLRDIVLGRSAHFLEAANLAGRTSLASAAGRQRFFADYADHLEATLEDPANSVRRGNCLAVQGSGVVTFYPGLLNIDPIRLPLRSGRYILGLLDTVTMVPRVIPDDPAALDAYSNRPIEDVVGDVDSFPAHHLEIGPGLWLSGVKLCDPEEGIVCYDTMHIQLSDAGLQIGRAIHIAALEDLDEGDESDD